jgi:hypothetical protein
MMGPQTPSLSFKLSKSVILNEVNDPAAEPPADIIVDPAHGSG